MKTQSIKTRVFKENENLLEFIKKYVKKLPERSIIVVTSKIVALSEGRTVVCKNKKEKVKIIKEESDFAIKTKYVWLTIKDGMVMASAGIDESNANGKIILLPKDSFRSAQLIRKELKKIFRVKNLGVIISDSRTLPIRAGTIGLAIGYAGFQGLHSYKGNKDIFGRILQFSRTDVADSLATSAVLCMGEGKEQQPLALVFDAPVKFVERINRKELYIDPREDIYQPLFEKIKKMKF